MRRHLQTFKLNLTYTMVEGDPEGLSGLRGVLGHIPGDLLSAQLPLIAALTDMAHVELLPPAGDQGHALVLVNHRAGHHHDLGGLANGCLEQLGREPSRRGHTGWAVLHPKANRSAS